MSNRDHHRVWHPFTQAKTAPPPLMVKRGHGVSLELEDGRKVLDMISSWWVNLHGHAHPEIAEAIYQQALNLEQVIFAGFTHEPAEEFARELLELINAPSASLTRAVTNELTDSRHAVSNLVRDCELSGNWMSSRASTGGASDYAVSDLVSRGVAEQRRSELSFYSKGENLVPNEGVEPPRPFGRHACDTTQISQGASGIEFVMERFHATAGAASGPGDGFAVPETGPVAENATALTGPDCDLDDLAHVFYSDNGSTAVEVALKMAFQYWQNIGHEKKTGFVCFEGGYHGDTIGAMSVGGGSPFWGNFKPLLFPVRIVPFPSTFEHDANVEETEAQALSALRSILENDGECLAAVVIEPLVQGAAGMRMCRPNFLASVRALAREFDVLLIFDEVMTGFGRTGDWFASTKSRVRPDILCLSKGITGGFLPLSATVCSSRLYRAFLSDDWGKMLVHGHSYTANPLALAAARTSLRLLKENRNAFCSMEQKHRQLSEKFLANTGSLMRHRYCGTIFAAEIQTAKGGYYDEIGPRLREAFLSQGLLIRPLGNTVYLLPPYCVTDEELDAAYRGIATVLSQVD